MTDTALASQKARHGNRYFKVDEGYDKRVYENSPLNYARITATLIFFYIFNAFHWWGCFEYGVYDTHGFYVYSIVVLFCSWAFIGGMLVSGKYANYNKRLSNFLEEVIAEKRAMIADEEERKEQERIYKLKLAKKAAADDRI